MIKFAQNSVDLCTCSHHALQKGNNLHHKTYKKMHILHTRKHHKLWTRKVSQDGKETLCRNIELCTNKNGKILQPRYQNNFLGIKHYLPNN